MGRTSDAKEILLSVAADLIWKQSYGAVSVDDICQKANVKKGSFYYFFPSKAALAAAAFEEHWQKLRPVMDQVFSSVSDPLQRIEDYCRMIYQLQKEKQDLTGSVLGCPYTSVGAELSAQDEQIRLKACEMFERACKYLETALRDACSAGSIPPQDFVASARVVYCQILGTLVHARIENDLKSVAELYPSLLLLLQAEPVPSR